MHLLVSGQTMSGKTTFALELIKRCFNPAGRGVLVLDDVGDAETWGADWVTDDPDLFLDTAQRNRECALIIDEGGSTIGRYNHHMEVLATKFRHLGHNCIFISQRPVQLPLTIRTQCGGVALFNSSLKDCKALSDDFNCPELLSGTTLDQGEYLYKTKFQALKRGRLFVPRRLASDTTSSVGLIA